MNVIRCGDCKFWGTEKDKEELFRKCTAIYHDKNDQVDEEKQDPDFYDPDEIEESEKIRKENLAITQDGSGYLAVLRTKEDFGCVLFKEKD